MAITCSFNWTLHVLQIDKRVESFEISLSCNSTSFDSYIRKVYVHIRSSIEEKKKSRRVEYNYMYRYKVIIEIFFGQCRDVIDFYYKYIHMVL